ncbi:membrane-associated tyrosine- and threonine-specific cdc2-inhibitory kinase isoform X1 [Hydra vulgaris]
MSTTTPRPIPIIIDELTFSRKKSGTRCLESHVPKSPIKSIPPISRIFRHRNLSTPGALSVSFRQSGLQSGSASIASPSYKNVDKLYFDQCFTKLSKLGSGSFGDVYKVQSKDDGKLYAVKKSRECFRGDFDRKQRLEEVNKNELLQGHVNCVQFYKAWEERGFLYIQTELCEMSLKEYAESVQVVEEKEIWNMLVDLCKGLKHIHDSQFIHMDIKPANLFLGRDGHYKIGDFGLVVELSRDLSDAMDGDSKYLAPELMEGNFSKAADIFSLGITILELACRLELPNGGALWHRLRNNQLPIEFTQGLSDDLILLITTLMNSNPKLRPTVDDILKWPCIKQAEWKRGSKNILAVIYKPFHWIYLMISLIYHFFLSKIFKNQNKINSKTHLTSSPKSNFNSSYDLLINKTKSNSASLSPICSSKNIDVSQRSPLLQGISKEKDSPLLGSLNRDYKWKISSDVTPKNSLNVSMDCSPPTAPLADMAVRSRLFLTSSEDDEVQIVPKNLLNSFNSSEL